MNDRISHYRAVAICCELNDLFHQAGYLLGLYGSCLTATAGNDIDLLAAPWRNHADMEQLDLALRRKGWNREVAQDYRGLMADTRVYRRYTDVLDVRFARVRDGAETLRHLSPEVPLRALVARPAASTTGSTE